MKLFRLIACIYLLIAALIFGVAYNVDYELRSPGGLSEPEINSVRATLAAIFWPLYASVKAFAHVRKENPRRKGD